MLYTRQSTIHHQPYKGKVTFNLDLTAGAKCVPLNEIRTYKPIILPLSCTKNKQGITPIPKTELVSERPVNPRSTINIANDVDCAEAALTIAVSAVQTRNINRCP